MQSSDTNEIKKYPKLTIGEPELSSSTSVKRRVFSNTLKFLGVKALLICITIFIGVFITITIVDQPVPGRFGDLPSQLDARLRDHIERIIRRRTLEYRLLFYNEWELDKLIEDWREELIDEAGLDLETIPRRFYWTFKALFMDWGDLNIVSIPRMGLYVFSSRLVSLNRIILEYLPFTLLLAGSAYLMVFLLGIPLALAAARNYGRFIDRFLAVLAPISSLPSWVIGLILIWIFAVELRVLPIGGIFDKIPPENPIGYVPIVFRHMILPVLSILISIFFQLVYTWRTYFLINSEEDYVELGKAMGLPARKLQKKYILKPSLTFTITSFSLMLVSFWQMTMALEAVFNWPGIGWLYITYALPNFWGESMYPGELLIALTLVVIFAYLLGVVVFLLDIIYVIVDPRIRYGEKGFSLKLKHIRRRKRKGKSYIQFNPQKPGQSKSISLIQSIKSFSEGIKTSFKKLVVWLKWISKETLRYPSAIIGGSIIVLLILGSIYAVVFLPYEEIGDEWSHNSFTGQPIRPKLAQPAWINIFRKDDYLSILKFSSKDETIEKEITFVSEDVNQMNLSFSIDYPYDDIPSELFIYLDSTYEEKRPYISFKWITPDGREFKLQGASIESKKLYDLENKISVRRIVAANDNWENWFVIDGVYPTPVHYLLFADPDSDQPEVVKGEYQILVEGITFEEGSDIDVEIYLFGKVYGLAGTDNYRRDLLVPLLWGMPFALLIGLVSSIVTTLIALVLAGMGVWFGGWVDNLIQRLSEANLILPVLAISVLAYAYLGVPIFTVLFLIILSNVFGTPTKNFRAAFLQIKDAPYIEAARSYGASNIRIIFKYLVPRVISILIPQIILLIPSFVFLEATLGIFNITSNYPTWGKVIYHALTKGAIYGSRYWVLQPLALLIITGLAFGLFGFALEKILNPRLLNK
jgi:peptide/nickel transport system permease protein